MKLRRSSNDQPSKAPSNASVATDGTAQPKADASGTAANDTTAALAMQAADVQNARFHTARKGYHKGEVDDFLDRVEAAIEAKNARIAELEAQSAAVAAPAAAPAAVSAAPAAVSAAAPVAAATPAAAYPAQQAAEPVAQPAAPQVTPALDTTGALGTAAPGQAPAAAPAAQTATGGGDAFAAGWYADPWSQATYRYYDGTDWTAQTR